MMYEARFILEFELVIAKVMQNLFFILISNIFLYFNLLYQTCRFQYSKEFDNICSLKCQFFAITHALRDIYLFESMFFNRILNVLPYSCQAKLYIIYI